MFLGNMTWDYSLEPATTPFNNPANSRMSLPNSELMSLARCQPLALVLLLAWLPAGRGAAADRFNSVYISECLAANERGLKDEDGERPAWIELCNGGLGTVSLHGWFLTDQSTNLTRWRLPNVALLPGRHLVVFASGKNRTNNIAPLHASFRLNRESRFVALVNRTTNIVSELALTTPSADVSVGRVPGALTVVGPLSKPTPGKPNQTRGRGFAPEVTFSKPAGNFIEPLAVELQAGGAEIRYTLDGTLPLAQSLVYTGALTLTNSTQLRARAYQAGILPGPPASACYLRLASNVVDFNSNLPVLVLDTFGPERPISPQDKFVHLSVHEPVAGRTWLTNAPAFTSRAGFRVRGSTSANMPQSGYALELLDEFDEERPAALLGMPADSDWILYAPNSYDPVLIHNPFVHQLGRDLGRYSSRARFVEVFLANSNGRVRQAHYQGLYVLLEKISVGKKRVDIPHLTVEDVKPPQVTGGYILKFDRLGPGEEGLAANNGRGLVYVEPKEQTLLLPQRAPQREYLQHYIGEFNRALHGPNWKDPMTGYRAFLDVDAAIDYHVLELLSGNVDAMVLSTYFHKPRQGKITCGPHWDFDRALGSTDERDANPRVWSTGPFFGGDWWPRLFRDPDFWQLWVDRWQELRQSHFSQTNLFRLIDQFTAEVREAQPREYKRWGLQPRGGSYDGEILHMKDWLSNRLDFIDQQLAPPPRILRATSSGMLLTLSAPPHGSVYYTLDRSDPRLPQGGISTNAYLYTNPVPLRASAVVIARTRDPARRQTDGPPVSTPWSRPVQAQFDK